MSKIIDLSQPHVIFSVENPLHPSKTDRKVTHDQTIEWLKNQGEEAYDARGVYAKTPEKSILVFHPKNLHGIKQLAEDLGQESLVYSKNKENELHYLNGENKGKIVKGNGTTIHTVPPEDNYTTVIDELGDPIHFTHNLDFSQLNKSDMFFTAENEYEDLKKAYKASQLLSKYPEHQQERLAPIADWTEKSIPHSTMQEWIMHHTSQNHNLFEEHKTELEHYGNMMKMNQAPDLKKIPFSKKLSFEDGMQKMKQVENEYIKKITSRTESDLASLVPEKGHIAVNISPDLAWWNLGVSRDENEAQAMGHCGTGRSGSKLYSLRQKVSVGNKTFYKPLLTFDNNSGVLGEMKGPGNTKPHPKHHESIKKLLLSDQVRTVVGGGYQPRSNFELTDLKDKEDFLKQKPALDSTSDNPEIIDQVLRILPEDETFNDFYDVLNSKKKHIELHGEKWHDTWLEDLRYNLLGETPDPLWKENEYNYHRINAYKGDLNKLIDSDEADKVIAAMHSSTNKDQISKLIDHKYTDDYWKELVVSKLSKHINLSSDHIDKFIDGAAKESDSYSSPFNKALLTVFSAHHNHPSVRAHHSKKILDNYLLNSEPDTPVIVRRVLENPNTDEKTLMDFINRLNFQRKPFHLVESIARNPNTTPDVLDLMTKKIPFDHSLGSTSAIRDLLGYKDLSPDTIRHIYKQYDPVNNASYDYSDFIKRIGNNRNTPGDVLREIIYGPVKKYSDEILSRAVFPKDLLHEILVTNIDKNINNKREDLFGSKDLLESVIINNRQSITPEMTQSIINAGASHYMRQLLLSSTSGITPQIISHFLDEKDPKYSEENAIKAINHHNATPENAFQAIQNTSPEVRKAALRHVMPHPSALIGGKKPIGPAPPIGNKEQLMYLAPREKNLDVLERLIKSYHFDDDVFDALFKQNQTQAVKDNPILLGMAASHKKLSSKKTLEALRLLHSYRKYNSWPEMDYESALKKLSHPELLELLKDKELNEENSIDFATDQRSHYSRLKSEIKAQLNKLAASEYNTDDLFKSEDHGLCAMFMFEGVDHPDILHITHKYFGKEFKDQDLIVNVLTKWFDKNPFEKITELFDKEDYFGENKEVKVLLPKNKDKFLPSLKEQLDEIVPDKWPEYKPHVSVSSNVDKIDIPIVNYVLTKGGNILWSAVKKLKKSELFKSPIKYEHNEESRQMPDLLGNPKYSHIKSIKLPNGLEYMMFSKKLEEKHPGTKVHAIYHPNNKYSPIAYMETSHEFDHTIPTGHYKHVVNWSEVDPAYRGRGIGKQLYFATLLHGTGYLTSGEMLSPAAHKIWEMFKTYHGLGGKISSYGSDPNNPDLHQRHHVYIKDKDQAMVNYKNMFPSIEKITKAEQEEYEVLEKAVGGIRWNEIFRANNTIAPKALNVVDTNGHLAYFNNSHPEYIENVLNKEEVVDPVKEGHIGESHKMIHDLNGQKFMAKPYHQPIEQWAKVWNKHHIRGWASLTTRKLFESAGLHGQCENLSTSIHRGVPLVISKFHKADPYSYGDSLDMKSTAKMAIMDFLTHNQDRHSGNVIHINGVPIAIDHDRNFQYFKPKTKDPEDALDKPIKAFQYYSNETGRQINKNFHVIDDDLNDWWHKHKHNMKNELTRNLNFIINKGVRQHIEDNFNERWKYVDDYLSHDPYSLFNNSHSVNTIPYHKKDEND